MQSVGEPQHDPDERAPPQLAPRHAPPPARQGNDESERERPECEAHRQEEHRRHLLEHVLDHHEGRAPDKGDDDERAVGEELAVGVWGSNAEH